MLKPFKAIGYLVFPGARRPGKFQAALGHGTQRSLMPKRKIKSIQKVNLAKSFLNSWYREE